MILRGAQIHCDGHGKGGLLPHPTFFTDTAQLLSTGVPVNTRTNHFNRIVSSRNPNREVQPQLRS